MSSLSDGKKVAGGTGGAGGGGGAAPKGSGAAPKGSGAAPKAAIFNDTQAETSKLRALKPSGGELVAPSSPLWRTPPFCAPARRMG